MGGGRTKDYHDGEVNVQTDTTQNKNIKERLLPQGGQTFLKNVYNRKNNGYLGWNENRINQLIQDRGSSTPQELKHKDMPQNTFPFFTAKMTLSLARNKLPNFY